MASVQRAAPAGRAPQSSKYFYRSSAFRVVVSSLLQRVLEKPPLSLSILNNLRKPSGGRFSRHQQKKNSFYIKIFVLLFQAWQVYRRRISPPGGNSACRHSAEHYLTKSFESQTICLGDFPFKERTAKSFAVSLQTREVERSSTSGHATQSLFLQPAASVTWRPAGAARWTPASF